ncbi:hypothetical protein [Haloferax chudinovii]|uniref:Envelope protein N-terminal domain-containing protein n=1 Tax=Haloferax chudinovii TaxID=1109010 RepID=A0ABD5XJ85_9EURY
MARVHPRRFLVVLLSVLIVTAGAAGPASAALGFQDCDISDSAISAFINSLINPNGDECRFNPTDSTQSLDGTQDKVELYSAASAEKTSLASYNTAMDNYLNDTESVAWMKAQVAVAEAYEDGKTKEQARIDAKQAIADYYAIKQKNDLARWNASLTATTTIENRSESDPINDSAFVTRDERVWDVATNWQYSKTYEGVDTTSVSLVNGSSADALGFNFTFREGYQGYDRTHHYYVTAARHQWNPNGALYFEVSGWTIQPPNENYESSKFVKYQSFADRWSRYETKNDDLQAEAGNFVNATYDDFAAGNINSSDVISANTAMFEYGTQSGSDSDSLYDSTAALALMGFDVPDMQSSGLMNVTDQSGTTNITYQGLVLARSAPNGSWSVNTTYNASTIDGPVFIATATGEKVDLDGNFTITEITARDGSSVQSQNTTTYVYKTANTSEFVNMTNELEALRQDIEEREQSSGGSGGSGGLNSQALGIALLVGAGAVLLIQREGNE